MKQEYIDKIANQLIDQMEKGTAPWQRPWKAGTPAQLPHNPTTGAAYKGMNSVWLMSAGHADTRWMTYKQASAEGAQVRKGEKGTQITYWQFNKDVTEKDENGKVVKDENGKAKTVNVRLQRPRAFTATVFNAEQIDGLPPAKEPEPLTDEKLFAINERAENILQNSGASIKHHEGGSRAFYSPGTDQIHLPGKSGFKEESGYYATALHELGHWSGHSSRLDRDLTGGFGSQKYAKEELRAEISSMMVGQQLEIGHDPEQHAAYVKSWIKVLKDDPKFIFEACRDAQKISEMVMEFENEKEIEAQSMLEKNTLLDKDRPYQLENPEAVNQIIANDLSELNNLKLDEDQDLAALYSVAVGAVKSHGQRGFDEVDKLYPDLATEILPVFADRLEKEAETVKQNRDNGYKVSATFDHGNGTLEPVDRDDPLANGFTAYGVVPSGHVYIIGTYDKEETAHEKGAAHVSRRAAEKKQEAQTQAPAPNTPAERTYLQIDYKQRHLAKEAGAKWDADPDKKAWYMPAGKPVPDNLKQFVKEPAPTLHEPKQETPDRKYLAVPYEQKDLAKAAGARFDPEQKAWFVAGDTDLKAAGLDRFDPKLAVTEPAIAQDPQQQFERAAAELGLNMESGAIPDGQIHRVSVEGDKSGKTAGAYALHLDGVAPGGYIENFKTGERVNWKAEGVSETMTPEQRAQLSAEAAQRTAQRERDLQEKYDKTAAIASAFYLESPLATPQNEYCQKKGITNPEQSGLKEVPAQVSDELKARGVLIGQNLSECMELRKNNPEAHVFKKGDLLVPAINKDGEIRTLQSVNPNFKAFMKDGQKSGSFAVVGADPSQLKQILGGNKDIQEAITSNSHVRIIVAEGFATADSVSRLSQQPVIAAFDSNNLDNVITQIKQPGQSIAIAADNDHEKEGQLDANGKPLTNVGLVKATEAAERHGGGVAQPIFKEGERGSDWNDLEAARGTDGAREALNQQLAQAKTQSSILTERMRYVARDMAAQAIDDPSTSADDAAVSQQRQRANTLLGEASAETMAMSQTVSDLRASTGKPAAAETLINAQDYSAKEDNKELRSKTLGGGVKGRERGDDGVDVGF